MSYHAHEFTSTLAWDRWREWGSWIHVYRREVTYEKSHTRSHNGHEVRPATAGTVMKFDRKEQQRSWSWTANRDVWPQVHMLWYSSCIWKFSVNTEKCLLHFSVNTCPPFLLEFIPSLASVNTYAYAACIESFLYLPFNLPIVLILRRWGLIWSEQGLVNVRINRAGTVSWLHWTILWRFSRAFQWTELHCFSTLWTTALMKAILWRQLHCLSEQNYNFMKATPLFLNFSVNRTL